MADHFHEEEDYRGKLDWGLWRRIICHARPYRRQLVGLGAMGLVIAAIDTLMPIVTGAIIDEAATNGMTGTLKFYALAYALLFVFIAATVYVFIVLAGQAATGIAYDLRRGGFERLQELSFSYYDTRPVGWLVSRLTSDCSKLSSLIPWFSLDLVWGTCLIAGIVGAMFWLSWKLALVVLTVVPILAAVTWFFQVRMLDSSRLVRRTNSQITANFSESIMGVRTTKSLVREDANLSEFQTLSTDMFRYSMRNAMQSAVYLPLVIALGSLGTGLALWRGGVNLGDDLTIGTLVAFMQFAALLYMPIQELARRFTELQAAQAAAERIQSLLDTTPAIRDAPDVLDAIVANGEAARGLAEDGYDRRIETVEFRDVSFWYKEGEPVLSDFNLTVHAGQTVALIGATGGGKSTIVSLVARFYEPSTGEVLINGIDYRKRSLHWLQSNLGVVLQTPHLFSGSVRQNIRYGDLNATEAEVQAAAKRVNAHDFIVELEDGYDTDVGEGGVKISTGQRQLVALARAVLADPQIFVMDEATSSVDTETERLIQAGIDAILSGRIAFVIAHRLSTVRTADVILVIDHGRIVEQGTHAQLMQQGGRYHHLYTMQSSRQRQEQILATSADAWPPTEP